MAKTTQHDKKIDDAVIKMAIALGLRANPATTCSDKLDVIPCWALDFLESARCGHLISPGRDRSAFVTQAI